MADEKNKIEQLEKLGKLRRENLALQKSAESSVSARLALEYKALKISRDIASVKKEEEKILNNIKKLKKDGTDEALKQLTIEEDNLSIVQASRKEKEEELETVKKIKKQSSKTIAILKSGGGLLKKWGWDNLKKWGVFEMDKELRNAARTIGVSSDKYVGFAKNLSNAAASTSMMGVNLKQLAKMQGDYSDGIGRATILTEGGAVAMAEMAAGTGLGEQFAVEMAVAMDNFGAGAEASSDLVENTMNIAAEMGVSGGKAVKTLQKTLQMSQRYVFKGGVKSLAKMANSAVKLKLDMDGIAGVADKVFRPEGAIELAAQLKTMGGNFSKIADPMQLMFKARNDFEGFAKDIGKASAEFVEFNAENGTFEIKGGLAADRMREIANMTGISVDKLQEMAVAQKRIEAIGSIVPLDFDDDDKELISSLAVMKDGEWKVNVGGKDKLVKYLNAKDKKDLINQKATLEKRAKDNRTFTDTLDDLFSMLQQFLLPVAIALKEALGKPLQAFVDTLNKDGVTKRITDWTFKLVEFGKDFGKWAIDSIPAIKQFGKDMWGWIKWGKDWVASIYKTLGPGGSLALLIGGSAALWALNGAAFGVAANLAMGGPGGILKGLGGAIKSGSLINEKMMVKGLAAGGIALAANFGRNYIPEAAGGSEGNLGKGIGVLGKAAEYAAYGSLLGPWGMALGGVLGAGKGVYDEFYANDAIVKSRNITQINDGVVKFNPKDKFLSIDDGTMIAGTNAGGNKDLAKAMTGGSDKIAVTHEHKPIKMVFEFIGLSENSANELINNDRFVKSLNIKIKEASANVFSGGKPSPNPTN